MIGKVILGIVGSVAVMTAIGSLLPHQNVSPIVKELVLIGHAKEDIRARLKDPDSAQFGKAQYAKDGRICIPTNARNGFGGYTGAQLICVDARPLVEAVQGPQTKPAQPGGTVVSLGAPPQPSHSHQ